MSELLEVAEGLTRAALAAQTCVLTTVLRTQGSTYRRIGARMVVLADGSHVGAVSAGCLEADVVLRAATVRVSGRPEVVTYDTRSSDELIWGFGLGCGGLIELLLQPLDPERAMAKAEGLRIMAELRHRTVLATVIRAASDAIKPGDEAMLDETAILRGFDGLDSQSRALVHRTAQQVLQSGCSGAERHILSGYEVDVGYEVLSPLVRFSVCGAGPDAIAVVAAARRLGWQVTLMDHRPIVIAGEQWPEVDRVVVPSLDAIAAAVADTECNAALVMNHHYERDLEFLASWIGTGVPYIGMLGPRQRTEQMLATLESSGMGPDQAARRRIRAPAGLNIGAETPEEIALAIVGEVQAVHVGRGGGFLSSHDGSIHGPATPSELPLGEWAAFR
jgi:xanthine dehydrogenase accessory factor